MKQAGIVAMIVAVCLAGCGTAQERAVTPDPAVTASSVAAIAPVPSSDSNAVGAEPRTVASGLGGGRFRLTVSLLPAAPGVPEYHWSLVEPLGDSAIVRARAPLGADAVWFDERVFPLDNMDLVLADFGNEYSWGTLVLAIDSGGVTRDLHLPEVAAIATAAEDAMGPGASALPFVSAALHGGLVRLEFRTDLIGDSGGRQQHLHCRIDPSRPIVFEQKSGGWAMTNARATPLQNFEVPAVPCPKGSA